MVWGRGVKEEDAVDRVKGKCRARVADAKYLKKKAKKITFYQNLKAIFDLT